MPMAPWGMPDVVLTPEELAARTTVATEAAFNAATDLGLLVEETRILHNVFSLVIHLSPSPVVARIPVVLAPGTTPEQLTRKQQRELDVADWLRHQNVPAVRPSPLVPLEPVREDDFSITFWELADVADDHEPYAAADHALSAALHAALMAYPGLLPFLSPFNDGLPALLESLEGSPHLTDEDLDRAFSEWHALRPVLGSAAAFRDRFPSVDLQPIQGDAPSHNVIRCRDGLLFGDFEDVCLGPVEWDLAGQGPEAVEAYNAAAGPLGMRTVDPDLQRVMDTARNLQLIGAFALVPQLPLLADGLQHPLQAWRDSPALVL
ncbi:aminoglycoside phosphotransferase family protein [Ornithinimicrobium sp. F0845]|uniref:phosphotransferase n=1 Tax=Ornithinimicrobium sp. F0845 TaxID=2926412 RepID=UPI001FF53507|nr:phosphotransferase [Ornithinimicrobium sp. F0845]MCK0113411.1 aminoglycoside phosphotransferase family protein [Ornithinimicrobium sp. F0845]